jgi:hypothetical protein
VAAGGVNVAFTGEALAEIDDGGRLCAAHQLRTAGLWPQRHALHMTAAARRLMTMPRI